MATIAQAQAPAAAIGAGVISGGVVEGTTRIRVPGAAVSLILNPNTAVRMMPREYGQDAPRAPESQATSPRAP